MILAEAISRLYHLRVDTTTRDGDGSLHEKPHKPLLLLAAFDLIDEGLATPDCNTWYRVLQIHCSPCFIRPTGKTGGSGSRIFFLTPENKEKAAL